MKKNFSFILLLFLLNIFLVSVMEYSYIQTNINEISNGLYTKNKVEIIDNDIKKYENTYGKNIRIFIEINEDIRVILKNNDWTPKLLNGRFIDVNEKGNKIIIGRDFKNSIQTIDNKPVINILNKNCEVIGLIGENFKSKIDSLMFIYLEEIPHIDNNFKIIIDGKSKFYINSYIDKLESNYGNLNILKTDSKSELIASSELFHILILILTILINVTTIFVYIRYYFEKNIKLFKVQYLLGLSKKEIILDYLRKIFVDILISNIILLALILILGLNTDIYQILCLLIISLIYCLILSTIFILKWFKCYDIGRGDLIV